MCIQMRQLTIFPSPHVMMTVVIISVVVIHYYHTDPSLSTGHYTLRILTTVITTIIFDYLYCPTGLSVDHLYCPTGLSV